MRLLLDEHISKVLAQELRRRGNDAIAVTEDASLVGAHDRAIFQWARSERRAVVTYDSAHFRVIAREALATQEPHSGIVYLNAARFPQGERYVGALLSALEQLLAQMPSDDALAGREAWL